MSKLIYLIVLTSLVTMLACSGDDPTTAPTREANPTSTPEVTPNPTVFVEEATATPLSANPDTSTADTDSCPDGYSHNGSQPRRGQR